MGDESTKNDTCSRTSGEAERESKIEFDTFHAEDLEDNIRQGV
jgi:hypothetical protein